MTQDEAKALQIGDRVVIQRKGRPTPHYGTVFKNTSQVGIRWEPYQWNGDEDGGEEYHDPQFMSRVERA